MVNRLRRSVSPTLEMSTPSIRIRPEVGSTILKNDSPSVLFPDPVLPRMPTLRLQISLLVLIIYCINSTFSPALISKLRL